MAGDHKRQKFSAIGSASAVKPTRAKSSTFLANSQPSSSSSSLLDRERDEYTAIDNAREENKSITLT
jgi:hypothetical protein